MIDVRVNENDWLCAWPRDRERIQCVACCHCFLLSCLFETTNEIKRYEQNKNKMCLSLLQTIWDSHLEYIICNICDGYYFFIRYSKKYNSSQMLLVCFSRFLSCMIISRFIFYQVGFDKQGF